MCTKLSALQLIAIWRNYVLKGLSLCRCLNWHLQLYRAAGKDRLEPTRKAMCASVEYHCSDWEPGCKGNTRLRHVHAFCAFCLSSFLLDSCVLCRHCASEHRSAHELLEGGARVDLGNVIDSLNSSQAAADHVLIAVNLQQSQQISAGTATTVTEITI